VPKRGWIRFTDEPDPGDPPAGAEVAAQSADGAEVVAG
jgi:hypothetical protein